MMPAVPCQHIADYYEWRWKRHKCIAWNLLRIGYRQWAAGLVMTRHLNNLY
jgi:hypothetical protein